MSTEEEKIKAEIAAAKAALESDLAKATGMVKLHMVFIAGAIGALLGFIAARIV